MKGQKQRSASRECRPVVAKAERASEPLTPHILLDHLQQWRRTEER